MENVIELMALDSSYTIVGLINATNIQWNRKYYETGTFNVQIPMSQYDNSMYYLYTKDRPEFGVITQLNYKDEDGYKYILLSGYFLENLLNDKIIYPQFIGNGTTVAPVIANMINTYKSDIDMTVVQGDTVGTATDFTALGENLGDKVHEILKLHEMSYKTEFDYLTSSVTTTLYQGIDRTESGNTDASMRVCFSTKLGNIKKPDVYVSDTNDKNYAIVKGSIDNNDIYVVADASDGNYQKQIMIDGTSNSYDADSMTEDSYKETLRQYGLSQLISNYSKTINIDFDAVVGGYEYRKDFDIGDKCDILITDIGLELEARIISVYEVIKDNQNTLTLEFGNKVIK